MNKTIDFGLLLKEVKDGNVRISQHPVHKSLYLFKYTQECVYSRKWNDINKMCRGLVVDRDTNEIILWPFEKFFNYDELDSMGLKIPNLPYTIYEKLDGSMIGVARYKDDLIVCTPGSFESYQVELAKEIINESGDILFLDNMTYVFEIIHPENRVVIDYGSCKNLFLLMVRNNLTGNEMHLDNFDGMFNIVERYDELTFDKILSERNKKEFTNAEGFVVRFENGFRTKVKYDEYFRIHKLFSNVNEKYVWENLMEGNDLMKIIENCPDEFFQSINEMVKSFNEKFNTLKSEYIDIFDAIAFDTLQWDINNPPSKEYTQKLLKNKDNRKQFAKLAKQYEYPGILFSMADKENVDKVIWNILKPE